MEENNLDRVGSQKRCSDTPITGENSIRTKRCNVEKQRRYMEQLRTPEKESDLLEYHRKKASRWRELRQKKKEAQSNSDPIDNATQRLKQQNIEHHEWEGQQQNIEYHEQEGQQQNIEYHEQEGQSNNEIQSSTQELKQQRNVEYQRRYMAKLRTPEKSQELLDYRQKRNARA